MLGTRLSAPRVIVSLFDDALAGLPFDVLANYGITRDLSLLGDLSLLPSDPVLFTMAPMTTKTQRFEDRDDTLFAVCCKSIANAPPTWVWETKEVGGIEYLAESLLESIPRRVVVELAQVVRDMADGDTAPFSPPGGWEVYRQRMTLARAVQTAQTAVARAKADGA